MIHRCRWPLVYGAILSIAQTAAAETPPEPVKAELQVIVHGEYCGPARISVEGEIGSLILKNPEGRVVFSGSDKAVFEKWIALCQKEAKQ